MCIRDSSWWRHVPGKSLQHTGWAHKTWRLPGTSSQNQFFQMEWSMLHLEAKKTLKMKPEIVENQVRSINFRWCFWLKGHFPPSGLEVEGDSTSYSPERELSGCSYSFVYFFSAALWRAWFWQKNMKFKLIIGGTLSIFIVQHPLKANWKNWLSLAVLSRIF